MHLENLPLISAAPGSQQHLQVLQFGAIDAPRKATIQAALHADEIPAMLVAQHLREQLGALESAGMIEGQVVLVPFANPIGLGQHVLGQHQGRFDLRDGVNFNRQHVDLVDAVAHTVQGLLGRDEAGNAATIRKALRAAAAELHSPWPALDLKHKLLQLAIDADVVLDLHCDGQAAMHLYTLTPLQVLGAELGALLGARAVLLADESGDSPFDEACSRPWLMLQQRFAMHPIPLGCFCATVELRGQADVSHDLARQDAEAIVEFLRRRGIVGGTPAHLPAARCQPTLLAASEPVIAPHAGIVVFHVQPGQQVNAGDLIADLVDPESGQVLALRAQSAGVLYARSATRWASPGARIAKIAGRSLARTGKLLGP
jgi:hypothetical protein